MIFSCRVSYLIFVFLFFVVSRPDYQCLGLLPEVHVGDSDVECRPVDIQLYTWSGPGFDSGECWHQGYRFANGATWGRRDTTDAPYCVCEQGKVRIFYSQRQRSPSSSSVNADSLTLLRPTHISSPTSNDLAKWPIPNLSLARQRIVVCSVSRLNRRVRSRDGCIGCKCSKNGHWLCRRPPLSLFKKDRQQSSSSSRTNSNAFNVHLRISTGKNPLNSQCPRNSTPQFCVLIERFSSSNTSEKSSRYIEIARESSWIDQQSCTKCFCTSTGRLSCEFLHPTCSRPCLLQKSRPIPILYYFPSGSKWLTPPKDKCRSCFCINGQRKCINCDQILQIGIDTSTTLDEDHQQQQSAAIGEFRLSPSTSNRLMKMTPCLLATSISSHRLISPGQKIWFEQRCYFCPERGGPLISC